MNNRTLVFVLSSFVLCLLIGGEASLAQNSPILDIRSDFKVGQEGNGGFVYKEKARFDRALTIMEEGIRELAKVAKNAPDEIFSSLNPPVDKNEFAYIVRGAHYAPAQTGYRVFPDGSIQILMIDYKSDDELNYKYIVVYAPMFVAVMYIDDDAAAKKFFQTHLIHEALHHFSYSEDEADVTTPILYDRLFPQP